MKRLMVVLLVLAVSGLIACSGKNTVTGPPDPQPTPVPTQNPTPGATPVPTQHPTPVPTPSPTPGLWQVTLVSAVPGSGASLPSSIGTPVAVTVRGVAGHQFYITANLGGNNLGSSNIVGPIAAGPFGDVTVLVYGPNLGHAIDTNTVRIFFGDGGQISYYTADFPMIYHWTN
jgi:hypothetical protein